MAKKQEFIPALVEEATKDFDAHLELEDNERIIFSGRYGIGKTSFLDYYFEKKKKSHFIIRLAPVNYSVSSNEDIFSYIKYDILMQLIEKGEFTFINFDFKKWEVLPFFIATEFKSILGGFLRALTKIASIKYKGVDKIYEELQFLSKKLNEYQEKANKSDSDNALDFISNITEKEGSIYEFNLITEIIIKALGAIDTKEKILIIDDLDRIDPEHIFRLLNVFSAHIDFKQEGDKFGFSKSIFVCDIDNIRNIFKTRYGADTDFNGYIDKFYSKKVFNFNNKNDLIEILGKLVEDLDFNDYPVLLQRASRSKIGEELLLILDSFRVNNVFNLRSLFKTKRIPLGKKYLFRSGSANPGLSIDHFISAIAIEVLIMIYGDKESLKHAFRSCIKVGEANRQLIENMQKHILALNQYQIHKGKSQDFSFVESEVYFTAELKEYLFGQYYVEKTTTMHQTSQNNTAKEQLNFYNQYVVGIEIMERYGAL